MRCSARKENEMSEEDIEKIERYLKMYQKEEWLRKTLFNNAIFMAETLETELYRIRTQDDERHHAGLLELARVTNETVSNYLKYEREYTRQDKYVQGTI